ncbi:MAG: hypothetical protein M1812_003895 [Candelaria pacifica]|nr:MAG: hypothetical protein M1812_003895 [Candelaria pacifica]
MPFPFLELPPELRNQIYRHCFQDWEKFEPVRFAPAPAARYRLRNREEEQAPVKRLPFRCYTRQDDGLLRHDDSDVPRNLLSILMACHQTNMEAGPIFYCAMQWCFRSLVALRMFLYQIGPKCRQHLSFISISHRYLEPLCVISDCFGMLATCDALSQLRINLKSGNLLYCYKMNPRPGTPGALKEPPGMDALRYLIRGIPNAIVQEHREARFSKTFSSQALPEAYVTAYAEELQRDLRRPKVQESDRWHSSGTTSEPTAQKLDGRWLLLNGPTFCTRGLSFS